MKLLVHSERTNQQIRQQPRLTAGYMSLTSFDAELALRLT